MLYFLWPIGMKSFTKVYIINRFSTITLNDKSPFECLFSIQPNYTMLKNFGCLFYPYFKTYTSHKLDSRSIPGTFLRYNLRHKGNKCISSDSWLYISSNVIFVEDQFPFAQKLFDKSPLVSQPIHTILPMCYRSKLVSLCSIYRTIKIWSQHFAFLVTLNFS